MTEIESRHATFLENEFPSKGEIKSTISLYETQKQTSIEHVDRPESS